MHQLVRDFEISEFLVRNDLNIIQVNFKNTEYTWFGLFNRDIDEWDDLDSVGQSIFEGAAKEMLVKELIGQAERNTAPATDSPVPPALGSPVMGSPVAGDDTLQRLLAQQKRLLEANRQGK